jgi:hypothetical protein
MEILFRYISEYPFILLEKGVQGEVAEIFRKNGIAPKVRFTTRDDYAIISVIEVDWGGSILSELVLQRTP